MSFYLYKCANVYNFIKKRKVWISEKMNIHISPKRNLNRMIGDIFAKYEK